MDSLQYQQMTAQAQEPAASPCTQPGSRKSRQSWQLLPQGTGTGRIQRSDHTQAKSTTNIPAPRGFRAQPPQKPHAHKPFPEDQQSSCPPSPALQPAPAVPVYPKKSHLAAHQEKQLCENTPAGPGRPGSTLAALILFPLPSPAGI